MYYNLYQLNDSESESQTDTETGKTYTDRQEYSIVAVDKPQL